RLALLSIKLVSAAQIAPTNPPDLRQQLIEIEQGASSLSDDMRSIAYQLYPAKLEDLGLKRALKILVREFEEAHSIPIQFSAGSLRLSIPAEVSLCLYRVTQEALRNISRHAGNTPVAISLSDRSMGLRLAVCDQGTGFDQSAKRKSGLGLTSMRERV